MSNRKNPFRHIRLVYRRSSPLLKCVVLAAIVLSTAALLMLHISIRDTRQEIDALRSEAARLEQENNRLEQNIGNLGSVQGVQNTAQEELGLVNPDTVVIGSGKQD